MNEFNIKIGGIDYTAYFIYPLNFQFVLDTALDQGYIEARNMSVTDAFKPFTPVEITINNESTPTIFYVAVDDVVINQKTGKATHKILLTEETKILERVICRAKTFVQPLVSNYITEGIETSFISLTNNANYNIATIYYGDQFYIGKMGAPLVQEIGLYEYYDALNSAYGVLVPRPNNILAVYKLNGSLTLADVYSMTSTSFERFNVYLGYYYAELIDVSTNKRVWYKTVGNGDLATLLTQSNNGLQDFVIQMPSYAGSFLLRIALCWSLDDKYDGYNTIGNYGVACEFNVSTVDENDATKKLYITDVVNKLLDIAEPIRDGETPRFSFNEADQSLYRYTQCAELNFANGATLWENLLEVARIVQCVPRLKNNVVYFDRLGEGIKITADTFGTAVSYTQDSTSEKFASHLDSVVNGLMNLDDEDQGAISDPFKNGFRTLRSETSFTDMRTTVDTAIIKTVKPIEKTTKVSVWYNGAEWDITPYVYEKKEYDLLYSNQGYYPYAKAYAIYYVQGEPNLYGLTYKQDNPISPVFSNWAIENILSIVTKSNVDLGGSSWDVITQQFTGNGNVSALLNLSFNVTYVSTVNGRVKQAKRDLQDLKINSVIAFNQSANRISSVNFGKRLKGEIAMLGSAEKHVIFKTKSWTNILNAVGKIYGDEQYGRNMFISSVTVKMWRDYFLVDLGLTKNFNQLGKYVGINSAVRQFEIDTNVSETYLLYEDYVCIDTVGNTPTNSNGAAISNGGMIVDSVAQTLRPTDNVGKATLAVVTTYDYDKNAIGKFVLPVQSLALGNSLIFNFRFEDNYSAGEYLQTIVNEAYKLTRLARYGDSTFGEVWGMRVQIYCDVGYNTGTKSSVGDGLPLFDRASISAWGSGENTALYGALVVDSGENPIIIHKSSRDAINFTYQVHLITNSGFILGDALTQTNFLVGGDTNSDKNNRNYVDFYDFGINEMTGEPEDHIGGNPVVAFALLQKNGLNITLDRNVTTQYGSWAIYNEKDQFVMGKNGPFEPITLTQFHKIGG